MTELETHLLNALKRMEQQFSEQLKESGEAQAALQSMFERTVEDNATLLKQVSFLDNRVNVLSEQLKQFGNLYKQNRR